MDTFRLPDLGEGLDDAEIVAWHVNVGDHVTSDQPLVSVETDKAVVEVPSPRSGRIARMHGEKGDLIKVGGALVEFADDDQEDAGTVVGALERHVDSRKPSAAITRAPSHVPRASPAVKALANTLGVDLALLTPTGPEETVTRADVERAAEGLVLPGSGVPLRGMRRAMAHRMAQAHREVVPAGAMDEADIGEWASGADVSVRVIRAIAAACKKEPSLNAHYRSEAATRLVLERIDIGIAVDTEDGLIVPVLRNAGERNARDLRAGLDRLRTDAAARVVPPDELKGATITLSNFGMFGGLFAHLVIVPPQVAIVGVGRATEKVLPRQGMPLVRRILPLSVMFDHRVVTGGEGARFLAALKADLERPD
jgi:pyruvate dehydrogenase E2 component (dihydrolipoamide acetyltransferase)